MRSPTRRQSYTRKTGALHGEASSAPGRVGAGRVTDHYLASGIERSGMTDNLSLTGIEPPVCFDMKRRCPSDQGGSDPTLSRPLQGPAQPGRWIWMGTVLSTDPRFMQLTNFSHQNLTGKSRLNL